MAVTTYRYQSEYAQMLRAEGEAKGRAEGRAEGEARGRIEEKASSVLRLLDRRGVVVPDAVRERITSCTDIPLLETWFDRALNATSLSDIFGIDTSEPGEG